ncbi:MAG: cyclic nucleotide-binding domain-containing protein [Deltaproteobacteria bacterium]|nr:cyclic nucleotide-binding domain-containing protein [Deltaproteobacteria bacterium]
MYLKQADLFQGMETEFVKQVMGTSVKETHREGGILFRAGDRATNFYILLKGRVRLNIGEEGQMVYTVSRAGEAFGWPSLIGHDFYAATAECATPTSLIEINMEKLQKVITQDPVNGLVFYRRLAATLGNRLLQSYTTSSGAAPEGTPFYGSSQVMEAPEAE